MKSIGIAIKKRVLTDNKIVGCENYKPISYESEVSDGKTSPVELHLNIWKINPYGTNFKSHFYLDIGLMVNPDYNQICLCLPFELPEKDSWKDLNKDICNDTNLLRAIFNEEYTATPLKNDCYYEVKDQSESKTPILFYLYQLGDENIVIKNDCENHCSRIEITVNDTSVTNEKDYYIRFRVGIKDIKQFCKTRNISNDFLQSAFSKLDLYDFRFNELRNISNKDKEYVKTNGYTFAEFSKIHVFFISSVKIAVYNGSNVKDDSRLIEPDIWEKYEPVNLKRQLCVAHHWKFKANESISADKKDEDANKSEETNENKYPIKPIIHQNLFFTAKYPKYNWFTISVYAYVIILLGAAGSWLSNITVDENFTFTNCYKLWIIIFLFLMIIIKIISRFRADIEFYMKEK